MWIGFAYIAANDVPSAKVWEVEPVQHGTDTLYRDVETGSVRPFFGVIGERLCRTQQEAAEFCAKRLEQIGRACDAEAAKVRLAARGAVPV
jgi:hypothetical protein